jgi:hypothetical protein
LAVLSKPLPPENALPLNDRLLSRKRPPFHQPKDEFMRQPRSKNFC